LYSRSQAYISDVSEEHALFKVSVFRGAHKRQAIRVWPHSEIFAGPWARKNACWGASPNPALWDKMELLTKCLKYRDAGDFKQEKRCLSASH